MIFKILKVTVILTTNNNIFMNLKYNRIDMKNRTKEGKPYKKGHQRISHPPITKLHKKRTLPAKRSPPTRDFATDQTSDFQPIAT